MPQSQPRSQGLLALQYGGDLEIVQEKALGTRLQQSWSLGYCMVNPLSPKDELFYQDGGHVIEVNTSANYVQPLNIF